MREGGLGRKNNLVIAVQEYVPTIIAAKIKKAVSYKILLCFITSDIAHALDNTGFG